jgi:para-aminobenzoate synthetase component I
MSAHLLIHPLPYRTNTAQLFSRFKDQAWSIFLDSGQPKSQYGRYDIFVANPFITIKVQDVVGAHLVQTQYEKTVTEVWQDDQTTISNEDPFAILNRLLKPYQEVTLVQHPNIPFSGGAVGYFGYDLGRQVEHLPTIAHINHAIPHMMVGIYDWAVVVDHREKKSTIVSNGLHPKTHDQWQSICDQVESVFEQTDEVENPFKITSAISSNMDYPYYSQAFNRIKAYIQAGDCYQVNLAQRFSAQAQGAAWQAYLKLREISPAPFMAYMNFGDLQVMSGSPERFLQVVNQHVETRPIKGTCPRNADQKIDQQNAEALKSSIKDRAENLMIVDLLRNDISKNCETGSVKADKLFQLQSFANVHHLVSIVTGKLAQGKTAIDLLRGCFPGGSITGAPKLRSMQIIEELEPHRRGVYCGAVGYIGFDGNMDTNITIRTVVYSEGEISFYAGGGIVADSVLENEYAETLDKAASIMKVMQFFQAQR